MNGAHARGLIGMNRFYLHYLIVILIAACVLSACNRGLIVVPVPDTAKAAADAMAFKLGVPSLEGLIRNRYIGRTFIEGNNRAAKFA